MRFQINLDCTPEEAREFFGMPDIMPLQQTMMEELSKRMSEGIQTMEPDVLMKTWVPAIFQSWSQMQQGWWSQMSQMNPAMKPGSFTAGFGSADPSPEDSPPESSPKKKSK